MNYYSTLDAARAAALKLSKAHPESYVTIAADFSWVVMRSKRLSVFAPSDCSDVFGRTGTYWKNGVEKPFTKAQRIADDLATPAIY